MSEVTAIVRFNKKHHSGTSPCEVVHLYLSIYTTSKLYRLLTSDVEDEGDCSIGLWLQSKLKATHKDH